MTFKPRQVLASVLILASTTLGVGACASARPIVTAPSACSSLVAPSLKAPVAPVDLPAATATAGDLWTAFDGQTERLDRANAFKAAVVETVEACEQRDAKTVAKLNARWWQFWR